MGQLNTYAYIVDRLSGYGDNTYDKTRVYLYDDFTQFVDYGRFGNESYISIYIDDDGEITGQGPAVTGYIYASSELFTKRDGTPTDCHIFDYIGANGVLMHAYTRIPDIGEDLVESFTSSGGNVDLIDNPDDFRYGAVLYLVSSKGNNGNKGGSGGQASNSYKKDSAGNHKNFVYRGGGGSGGSGGSGGKGVSIALTLANFLEDGTADFDNGVTTGTIVHAGEAGAGGGGGGGGEGGYYAKGGGIDLDWSAGSGGAGGYANVASQTNRIYIPHNVAVKCTSYSYTSGPSGSTGSSGGGGGSSTADFHNLAKISGGYGGSGGKSGNGTSGASGGSPWGGSGNYRGGNGGAGASENNVSTKTTVDKTIDGKRVYTTAHEASSSYSIANSLASTGGMALAKLVPYYTT